MKSNRLLKWLMVPLVLLLGFVLLKLLSPERIGPGSDVRPDALTPDEMKALGIEGDTPRDTVATLVAQVKQLRNELQTALNDNKNHKADNERLRQREQAIDQRVQQALDSERDRLREERTTIAGDQQQTQGLLSELQRRLDSMGQSAGNVDLPIGLGLQDGDGNTFKSDEVRWIEPADQKPADAAKTSGARFSLPKLEAAADTLTASGAKAIGTSSNKAFYTVPANSTLMGSIAMTALIGRVPVDGTVNDPYPFKVVIGADNLTANGIDLPEVTGAIVSGSASGDWTLSCVRGQIRSITFVFEDGTIRTLPKESQGQALGATTDGGLGWISDPYGIPCVAGERRSNAQQYLSSQALITAAGAGAASLIKSDNGTAFVSNGNNTLGTVGISSDEAMGRILSSGVQDMSQWVNKLYGQAFAAVYVEPGAKVAVHIEQPLTLDYDPTGRKVDHTLENRHVTPLD
ncbi:TIGR03752 family integrating conjugative element protein [Pseudomonas mosselii]|uniref:TIGR03752 family integrating conjugative element protein n=1 Tax=Pseudomonas mosselii TaxID=78327 RepID=UPI0027DD3803|nr:TIGR03752 family integrating conjugative element protein [Pseudomonas mosselii]